jgi:hypothetical protein
MVMSGEVLGAVQVAYLKTMEAFDRAFPGFEAEIQVRVFVVVVGRDICDLTDLTMARSCVFSVWGGIMII